MSVAATHIRIVELALMQWMDTLVAVLLAIMATTVRQVSLRMYIIVLYNFPLRVHQHKLRTCDMMMYTYIVNVLICKMILEQ